MNIDILFTNSDLDNHGEYFDENQFKEYCETHSFNGKLNQILLVPPSYSKNQNKIILVHFRVMLLRHLIKVKKLFYIYLWFDI